MGRHTRRRVALAITPGSEATLDPDHPLLELVAEAVEDAEVTCGVSLDFDAGVVVGVGVERSIEDGGWVLRLGLPLLAVVDTGGLGALATWALAAQRSASERIDAAAQPPFEPTALTQQPTLSDWDAAEDRLRTLDLHDCFLDAVARKGRAQRLHDRAYLPDRFRPVVMAGARPGWLEGFTACLRVHDQAQAERSATLGLAAPIAPGYIGTVYPGIAQRYDLRPGLATAVAHPASELLDDRELDALELAVLPQVIAPFALERAEPTSWDLADEHRLVRWGRLADQAGLGGVRFEDLVAVRHDDRGRRKLLRHLTAGLERRCWPSHLGPAERLERVVASGLHRRAWQAEFTPWGEVVFHQNGRFVDPAEVVSRIFDPVDEATPAQSRRRSPAGRSTRGRHSAGGRRGR